MKIRGFTLIELLIVITVIAILALIVIPKLTGASRSSKESTLSANVQQIRSAIAQFQGDTGVYPAQLTDILLTTAPTTGAGGASIATGTFKGPYLTLQGGINASGLPINPFVSSTDTTIADHWTYTAASGTVVSAVAGTTIGGVAYSNL